MIEELKQDYVISTDKSKLNLSIIHNFLKRSHWAENIPLSTVESSINNSLCFGVYKSQEQVGFARVITDYATFAFLTDVFILEAYRGQGLGKLLIKSVLEYPELQGLRDWLLITKETQGLYRQYGFQSLTESEGCMGIINLSVYKQ